MIDASVDRRLVDTGDGRLPVFLSYPAHHEGWPVVILLMDGPGIRPAMHAIAARLAGHGYAAALPDLFWRAGPYPPVDPRQVFTDPVLKERHRETLMATATPANVMADLAALLTALAEWPECRPGPMGVLGYCMGGRLALIAAGTFPDAVAVAASFHGGGLADHRPTSPHLLAPRMKARVYVGAATDDPSCDAAMQARLGTALAEVGVDHRIEVYPARHGWVPDDTAAHDPEQAEQHWRALLPLLAETLTRA
jgi:carboxymethylenebutenolidase